MVYVVTKTCIQCGKEMPHSSGYNKPFIIACDECNKKELARRKEEYLNNLKQMSIEDRLSQIEEIMYDEAHEPRDIRFK